MDQKGRWLQDWKKDVCYYNLLLRKRSRDRESEKKNELLWECSRKERKIEREKCRTKEHCLYANDNISSNLYVNFYLSKDRFRVASVTRLGDFCTLGSHSKPVATIILPKLPTLLGNFCKGVKIIHFSCEIVFGQLL